MACCACACAHCGSGFSSDVQHRKSKPLSIVQLFVCSFHTCTFHSTNLDEVVKHKSAATHGCYDGERCGVYQQRHVEGLIREKGVKLPPQTRGKRTDSLLSSSSGLAECRVVLERCDERSSLGEEGNYFVHQPKVEVETSDYPDWEGLSANFGKDIKHTVINNESNFLAETASVKQGSEQHLEEEEELPWAQDFDQSDNVDDNDENKPWTFSDTNKVAESDRKATVNLNQEKSNPSVSQKVIKTPKKKARPSRKRKREGESSGQQPVMCKFLGCEGLDDVTNWVKHKDDLHYTHSVYDLSKDEVYSKYLVKTLGGFKCKLCGKSDLRKLFEGQRHVAFRHADVAGNETRCIYCFSTFRLSRLLRKHVMAEHPYISSHETVGIGCDEYPPDTDAFCCHYCPLKLSNGKILELHEDHHKALRNGTRRVTKIVSKYTWNRNPVLCNLCGYKAGSASMLREHTEALHGDYECKECGFRTSEKRVMTRHQKKAHNRLCDACHFPFSRGEDKETHDCPAVIGPGAHCVDVKDMARVDKKNSKFGRLPSGILVCNLCGYTSKFVYKMPRHIQLMHSDKSCRFCDFRTGERPVLMKHMKYAHKLTCPWCKLVVTAPSHLDAHKCPQESAEKMSNPMPVAQNSSLQPCHICGFIPTSSVALTKHMAAAHGPENKPAERHNCVECGMGFKSKISLTGHVRRVHQKLRFTCSACDATFTTKQGLRSHEKSHEEGREFRCLVDGCGFTCTTHFYLMKHEREAHQLYSLTSKH